MNKKILFHISFLAGLLALLASSCLAADISIKLEPTVIHISTFYNGSSVKLSGTIPAKAEAFIRLSGLDREIHLKKKGKVAGILWMNTGDVVFKDVPDTYMLLTSSGLKDEIDSPKSTLGFAALERQITIEPADNNKNFLFKEFVKLQRKNHVYLTDDNAVQYSTAANGMRTFAAVATIPPKMKPGTYTIEVFALENGTVIGTATKTLTLEETGFPKQLANLAFNHSLLYGIMAVLVALVAGLITGVLFKGKGGVH